MTTEWTLDKACVQAHFCRAAKTYDAATLIEREAGNQMLSRLDYITLQPKRIMDLGSGTGYFSRKLAKHYRHAQVIELDFAETMLHQSHALDKWWHRCLPGRPVQRVCADMERIPVRSHSIDMLWSNFSLLWLDRPDQMLAECARILSPQGVLMFCTLGPDTLKELRMAFGRVDTHVHTHRFIDMHDLGDALVRHGFSDPVIDMEIMKVNYDTVITLLLDLQATGSNNALMGRLQGLMGKHAWQSMLSQYASLRTPQGLPATYEVIYGHAWNKTANLSTHQYPIRFYP